MNKLTIKLKAKHTTIPHKVGTNIEINVHLFDLVSFFIVKHVVEHGQCIKENNITEIAVVIVHPLSTNKVFNSVKLLKSVKLPVAI